jgi:hypothetical protein
VDAQKVMRHLKFTPPAYHHCLLANHHCQKSNLVSQKKKSTNPNPNFQTVIKKDLTFQENPRSKTKIQDLSPRFKI